MTIEKPRIISVGTANPATWYSQREVIERYGVADPRIQSLFTSGHIDGRSLILPPPSPEGVPLETQGQLLAKHLAGAKDFGARAVHGALEQAGLTPGDVDYLVGVTTTGFMAPGLSAHLVQHLGMRPDCARLDVVGMGCNAGLNGLNPTATWARAHPGKNALMACIEVCSAAYVFDNTMRTAVVNSLFGDGAAAIVVRADPADDVRFAPEILDFESHIIVPALRAMRYDWDDTAHKFSFFLAPDIPYFIGEHAETPVDALLARHGLRRRHVAHWVVHSGGKKVIDAMMYNLGLTAHDVRHTVSVLRDHGNLSSGSFLFSLQRLHAEHVVERGDYGVFITMGPGTSIETALVRW
ncbi:MAG: 3,5-dihydroxyphenylacetyl-CoA synthase DpgA [Pseudomonadota bacterium]